MFSIVTCQKKDFSVALPDCVLLTAGEQSIP